MEKKMTDEHLIYLPETDSTNVEMRRCLAHNPALPHGTTVWVDYQSAGRGQQGTCWESERGANVLFSTLLRPQAMPASCSFVLSQLVSLSLVEVLGDYLPAVTVKWPNDIYCGDKKLVGILIENDMMDADVSLSIAGIGVNVNQTVFRSSAPNPVSMAQVLGAPLDRRTLLDRLVGQLVANIDAYRPGDDEAVSERYRKILYRGSGFYPYFDVLAQESISAEVVGVEPSGRLTLRTDRSEIRHFMFKEVRYMI